MASLKLDPTTFLNTKVEFIADGRSLSDFDTLIVVGEKHVTDSRVLPRFDIVNSLLKEITEIDAAASSSAVVLRLPQKNDLGIQRVVFAPTGPLNRDIDDARRYEEAAANGVKRALSAGAKSLLVFVDVESKIRKNPCYEQAELVSVLGALRALYKTRLAPSPSTDTQVVYP